MVRLTLRLAVVVTLATALGTPLVFAQDGYRQPPAPIAQILDAPPTPNAVPSPNRDWLLLIEPSGAPSIAQVGAPFLRLAGHRVNPRTNGPHLEFGAARGMRLVRVAAGEPRERRIETVQTRRITGVQWSPDGAHVAFSVNGDSGIALWVADVATGRSRRLTEPRLNSAGEFFGACRWAGPSRLACKMIPTGRGAPPSMDQAPTGPAIQETTEGPRSAIWTYQNLLTSPADEALFEHYFTSQIAFVGLDGTVTPVGRPGIYTAVLPSPDGQYLAVQAVHRPYSYQVELSSFPMRTEVWSTAGSVVKLVADRPLQEVANNFDFAQAGPRGLAWRADAPATLVWAEALDGGNPKQPAEKRDRVVTLAAPFAGDPAPLIDLGFRYGGVQWTRTGLAVVSEGWQSTRRARQWLVDTRSPNAAPTMLFDLSSEDRYRNPGSLLTAAGPFGAPVIVTTADGRHAYRAGPGASPEGDRPFLDRVELVGGKSERLWRSAAPHYEEIVALLDPAARRAITRREGVEEPPNYFVREVSGGGLARLTSLPDPAPQLAGVTKQLLRYKRADGVDLSATLYLPTGYNKDRDGPLPFLLWAYPTEFKDAAAAGQTRGSPYRFGRSQLQFTDHLLLLTQGYGVLDDATMPIIGEGEKEPNDTYVEQLVASAKAAVDKIAEMGVGDPERVAVGGHSYGAFMTANLLAHSRLFRAGVARSGAYNRTLTPFGFQRESRSFWEADEIYMRMSPFTHADKLKDPILFIHGAADSNPGTYTIQSERMYAAVKGTGGKARLVLLPAEDHGYSARESIGHLLWETVTWLDTHVKPKPKPKAD
jgi:dipeptidyl aminopeptidase/acylaminoacyl peptidase